MGGLLFLQPSDCHFLAELVWSTLEGGPTVTNLRSGMAFVLTLIIGSAVTAAPIPLIAEVRYYDSQSQLQTQSFINGEACIVE